MSPSASSRERQRHSAGNKGQRGLTQSVIGQRRRARALDAWAGQAREARGGWDLDTTRPAVMGVLGGSSGDSESEVVHDR
jgi:hypothetical protein